MTTPDKYQAETMECEQKEWLYKQYWGELKSQKEVAETADVGRKKIRIELLEHGIPTRQKGWVEGESSPFRGFYNDETAPTITDQSHYDASKQNQKKAQWERNAENDETVSLDWVEE